MGQKVHPIVRRKNLRKPYACWISDSKNYANYLLSDLRIRSFINKNLIAAKVGDIYISRNPKIVNVDVYCAYPGKALGKKGALASSLKKQLSVLNGGIEISLNIKEIKKPDLVAKFVADVVAEQLEKRVSYRKAMKRAIQNTMKAGAMGIQVMVSGRLGGAEIARSERAREGRVPLHTIRADIDYHLSLATTTHGVIGVKVLVCSDCY